MRKGNPAVVKYRNMWTSPASGDRNVGQSKKGAFCQESDIVLLEWAAQSPGSLPISIR